MSNYSDSSYNEQNQNNSWYKAVHLVPDGAKVLDIGCSSGNFGEVLIRERHCIVDGIELDEADAKEASRKLRMVKVLNIETDDISSIKERYDMIYFGDVIEHLVRPVDALKKVKSLLKDNGGILFSVPNMAHATVRLQMLKGSFDYTETGSLDKTHLHFYTQDELQRIFAEAGYVIAKLEFVEKDYPDELIKDYLAGIGLTAKKQFLDMMREPAAAAFQFVGFAKPGKARTVKRMQFGPIDMFESYYNNTINPLRDHVRHLEGVVKDLTEQNEELHKQLEVYRKHPAKTLVRLAAKKAVRTVRHT